MGFEGGGLQPVSHHHTVPWGASSQGSWLCNTSIKQAAAGLSPLGGWLMGEVTKG